MTHSFCLFNDFLNDSRRGMIDLWRELVNIDSGPECFEGLERVAKILAERLNRLGLSVETRKFEGAPSSIYARRAADETCGGKIVLLGHMDTVFPEGTAAARPFSTCDDRVTGPGVLDMKGGLVQILYALEALNLANWYERSIDVVISGDEEVGHERSANGSRELFDEAGRGAVALFCCESGREDDTLVTARKGVGEIVLTTHGKSAHAGNDFWSGANAIVELANKIADIAALNDGENGEKTVTLNVGTIRGGMANNAVPDFARATVDVRWADNDDWPRVLSQVERIASRVRVPGTWTETTSRVEIPSMQPSGESHRLLEYVSAIHEKITGSPLRGASVGGGADSSFFAAAGVPCLCAMGPSGAHNHTQGEHASISSLMTRTLMLTEAISGMR